MTLITSFYQLTGFDFFEDNFFSILGLPKKFLSRLVFLLHFAYCCTNLKYQYDFQLELFKHPDVTGNITNGIEMVLPVLCHITLICESFCNRRKEEKTRKYIRKIQSSLNCSARIKLISLPIVKFIFLFVINSLIYVLVLFMVNRMAGEFLL